MQHVQVDLGSEESQTTLDELWSICSGLAMADNGVRSKSRQIAVECIVAGLGIMRPNPTQQVEFVCNLLKSDDVPDAPARRLLAVPLLRKFANTSVGGRALAPGLSMHNPGAEAHTAAVESTTVL